MSTIQNFKNFIRHGRQARGGNASPIDPITSNIHGHAQPNQAQGRNQAAHDQYTARTEPDMTTSPPHQPPLGAEYSARQVDHQNAAARVGNVAAHNIEKDQRLEAPAGNAATVTRGGKIYDQQVLQQIIAEEKAAKGQLPDYPGLERYELKEKMGDGAFSNVYRALDKTGKYPEVAIKVVRKFEMNSTSGNDRLHPNVKKTPKAVERSNILKEVQIMRQLDHPNVVKLVEFNETSQYYFIVLELCPGGELFHQIVRLTYFSENLTRHVIVQVAKALRYIHEEKGVVHRDIKPENLLFYPIPFIPTRTPKSKSTDDEDKADEGEFVPGAGAGGIGQVKIADFGLSKIVWEAQTMTPCGTVGYTAPEIVKDERYSKSVDMWALGCVLYTLLCGFPPFYDESIQVLTEKVARGQYTFLSPWWDDISKSAQDLVSHLLTVDPDKRYTIDQFLAHPWVRQSAEPTTAAADAPPLATPAFERQRELAGPYAEWEAAGLETPGGGKRYDFRSPGAINLREVFDVGYAVRRQEEEGKRRKNFKQGYGNGAAGMAPLNEDYSDSDEEYNGHSKQARNGTAAGDVHAVEQKMRKANIGTNQSAAAQARNANYSHAPAVPAKGYGQHGPAVVAAARQSKKAMNPGAFELTLDNSTLLGRRGNKKPEGGPLPSRLRQEVV